MKRVSITNKTVLTPLHSKHNIDQFLKPLFARRMDESRAVSLDYETLWQEVATLYAAGGKRLRSYMTLLTYEAFSGQSSDIIIPAAAAQELLHLAMLVHDDIIDRDTIRYGRKNITGKYLDHYQELIQNEDDRRHYAESAAILGGDLLISEAYILIAETPVSPRAVINTQQLLSRATFHVLGGELLDTEAAFRGIGSADPLLIAEQKTASYSFVSPFLVGATLAEASQEQLDLLRKLGELVGVAYQLRDDIIGVFGDEATSGKSAEGDIREGKRTVLIDTFHQLATDTQRADFDAIFGNQKASSKDIARARAILQESGARDTVESIIDDDRQKALELVKLLETDNAHKKAFTELVKLSLKRTS